MKQVYKIFSSIIKNSLPLEDNIINLTCPKCQSDLYPFNNEQKFTFCCFEKKFKEEIQATLVKAKWIQVRCLICGEKFFEQKYKMTSRTRFKYDDFLKEEIKYYEKININSWLVDICKQLLSELYKLPKTKLKINNPSPEKKDAAGSQKIFNKNLLNLEDNVLCFNCKLASKCKFERVCTLCGELKPVNEWCLIKSDSFCLSCCLDIDKNLQRVEIKTGVEK